MAKRQNLSRPKRRAVHHTSRFGPVEKAAKTEVLQYRIPRLFRNSRLRPALLMLSILIMQLSGLCVMWAGLAAQLSGDGAVTVLGFTYLDWLGVAGLGTAVFVGALPESTSPVASR